MKITSKCDIRETLDALPSPYNPILLQSDLNGAIYVFFGPTTGICLSGPTYGAASCESVGNFSTALRSYDNQWTRLAAGSKVTLTFEQ